MSTQLTNGGIHKIFNESNVESVIFQVLIFHKVKSGEMEVYRLKLSDGTHYSNSCVVGNNLNGIIGNLTPNSVIRVNRYTLFPVNKNRKIVVVLDLNVLHIGERSDGIIGNPIQYETYLKQGTSSNTVSNSSQQAPAKVSTNQLDKPCTSGSLNGSQDSTFFERSSSVPVGIHPISSLTPGRDGIFRGTIRARVTNKSNIIPYKNTRGEGKRFFMDLLDESGEIRAAAFNRQCHIFYNFMKVDNVYFISKVTLNKANKLYNSLKNDYEMVFSIETKVTLCKEETNIPNMPQSQFVNISQLQNVECDTFVDVIGICKEIADVSILPRKELKKRDVLIVDDSGKEIRLTLWGAQAENFDCSLNSIIAVKGAKVSDFDGRSLSLTSYSTLKINPDIKESHKLREWYENVGCNRQTENLPKQERACGRDMDSNLRMIGEAYRDQANYYSAKATLIYLKKRKCLYTACPSKRCNKKVTKNKNGVYHCTKCKKNYDTFNWRYVLKGEIADRTGSVCVTLFQEQAERLVGCTSATLGAMKEDDEDAFLATLDSALFKECIFTLKVKTESCKNEKRLETTVASVQPLDYTDYNKFLLEKLKSMAGLS